MAQGMSKYMSKLALRRVDCQKRFRNHNQESPDCQEELAVPRPLIEGYFPSHAPRAHFDWYKNPPMKHEDMKKVNKYRFPVDDKRTSKIINLIKKAKDRTIPYNHYEMNYYDVDMRSEDVNCR